MPHRLIHALIVTAFMAAGLRPVAAQNPPPAGAGDAFVTLDGRRLFPVRTNLGPFNAQDRADATSARLLELARDLSMPVGSIAAVPEDATTDIVARDRVLLTIIEADARAAHMPRAQLAAAAAPGYRITRERAQAATGDSVGLGPG